MTLDEAKQLAYTRATRGNQRYYVIGVDGEHDALTRDEIDARGIGMANSPSPALGYYEPSAVYIFGYVQFKLSSAGVEQKETSVHKPTAKPDGESVCGAGISKLSIAQSQRARSRLPPES